MWDEPPSDELLTEAGESVRLTLRLSASCQTSSTHQLLALATANMLLRLPFETSFAIPHKTFSAPPPPYEGSTLESAIQNLGEKLHAPIQISAPPHNGGVSLVVDDGADSFEFAIEGTSWTAMLRSRPFSGEEPGNALSLYAAAAMATAESVRAWARSAARRQAPAGEQFMRATRPVFDATINLWRPGTSRRGPGLQNLHMPHIDWVGGGAVTQAALCILAAIPGLELAGRIFDPKDIDEPDLNRSILSFVTSVGSPKPEIIRAALPELSELQAINDPFPAEEGEPSPWIVCGADDVSIRATCQALWPSNLVVVATEGHFGQVSRHTLEDDHLCGGCFTEAATPEGPASTIVSTSVMSGVVGAALLARLAIGDTPPARTDILTMRLDSALAVSEVAPKPNPDCKICQGKTNGSPGNGKRMASR